MSKTWKWILGIVAILALVGAALAAGYFWQSRMDVPAYAARGHWERQGPPAFDSEWNGPIVPGRVQPRMRYDYPRHFGGFFPLIGLLKFAVFLGALYGAYWLGRRNARITLDPAPGAPVAEAPAPIADAAPAPPEPDSPPAPRKRARKAE
ncbi:MAG: hypothetical protein AB1750_16015 [Chloroflexota bacterium]